ncbi:MAG TPA: VWA domain-containing protein [Pirellulales bacterium]|nr:VWA domain-containing protein [Pirellulales bacterium]
MAEFQSPAASLPPRFGGGNETDAVGLISFDTKVRDRVPPRQGPGHLRVIMEKLEQTAPGGETGMGETLHELAESIKRRACVGQAFQPDERGALAPCLSLRSGEWLYFTRPSMRHFATRKW